MIFGAGITAEKAFIELGSSRVACFIVSEKQSDTFCGKPVIDYNEMLLTNDSNCVIIVASEKHHKKMEAQLIGSHVMNYFVYHQNDFTKLRDGAAGYMLYGHRKTVSYNHLLTEKEIKKYNSIAIFGDGELVHYLICEIAFQNALGFAAIKGIIKTKQQSGYSLGLPYVTLQDVWDQIDCLVVNQRRNESDVFDVIENKNHGFDVVNLYSIDELEPLFVNHGLRKYKSIHKGKRIWLIGNGPSLRIEDLEILHEHQEISFGFNNVYKAFNRTNWRPTYIATTDPRTMVSNLKLIKQHFSNPVFAADRYLTGGGVPFIPDVEYVHLNEESYYPNMPDFSEDIERQVFLGCTSVYDIGMQFAVYMGASEVYLLGVDNTQTKDITDERNHFIKDYFNEAEKAFYDGAIYSIEWAMPSYQKAEQYSRAHGFRIYNATRGGNLDVFERVEFDSLF